MKIARISFGLTGLLLIMTMGGICPPKLKEEIDTAKPMTPEEQRLHWYFERGLEAMESKHSRKKTAQTLLLEEKRKEAEEAMLSFLTHEDEKHREVAVFFMAKCNDEKFVPQFRQALKDPVEEVRWRAIQGFRILGKKGYVKDITSVYDEKFENLAPYILESLSKLQDEEALPFLYKILADKKSQLRSRAAEAMGEMGLPAAIDELVKYIDNTEETREVREATIWALGKLQNINAAPALIKLIEAQEKEELKKEKSEQDKYVIHYGKQAAAALRDISGRDFIEAKEWSKWYKEALKEQKNK